jgi:hypothetical protein
MEVTVTTPKDMDGLQLTVSVTGRDVVTMGHAAYEKAMRDLADSLAREIFVKAVTRSL